MIFRARALAGAGLACVFLLAGCAQQPQDRPFQATLAPATAVPPPTPSGAYPAPPLADAYPAPDATAAASGPADPQFEGRDQTALDSYAAALAYIEQEVGPVELYAILPSHIMLRNFGNPPVEPGWFYKFQAVDDSSTFHFVQVVDGTVLGSRSLTPLGEDEAQVAIDISAVTIDSPAVFERFRQRAPELGITVNDALVYDLELVHLPGSPGPIWSVVTPEGSQWLFSINAVTGEETTDPRA